MEKRELNITNEKRHQRPGKKRRRVGMAKKVMVNWKEKVDWAEHAKNVYR
jgi:hypothetical protein